MTEKITMAKKKKRPPKTWMLPSPTQRTAKAAVSASIKADLDARATKLVEERAEAQVRQAAAQGSQGSTTSSMSGSSGSAVPCTSARPTPALVPRRSLPRSRRNSPEWSTLAVGDSRLSYMRHTDKWFRLFPSLTVDECLDAIENDCHFQMD